MLEVFGMKSKFSFHCEMREGRERERERERRVTSSRRV